MMMEFMERRSGGGATTMLGRIMLKYRPIAPKPIAGGAPVAMAPEKPIKDARGKRKVTGRAGRRVRKSIRTVLHQEQEKGCFPPRPSIDVVTLPLMPETPDRKELGPTAAAPSPSPTSSAEAAATWQQQGVAPLVRAEGSWVTVETVTETWGEEEVGFSCSDQAVAMALERDASPCFVSDALGRVTWTNTAYRRMVVEVEEEDDVDVRVTLATRGMVPAGGRCRAFTCRVTVRYVCEKRGRVTLAAPCDVWCLFNGALAWRLDLKAALSLSLAR